MLDAIRSRPLPLALLGVVGGVIGAALAASVDAPAAIIGALAIVAIAGAWLRPDLGLVMIGALGVLAPFVIVPVRIGAQPPVVDLILVATLAAAARLAWRGPRRAPPRWFVAGVGAVVVAYLAAATAAWPGQMDVDGLQYGIKLALAASLPLAVSVVRPGATVRRQAVGLVAGGVGLQAAIAIVLWAAPDAGRAFLEGLASTGYPAQDVARFLPDGVTRRATGLLIDPNVLGVTLAAGLPFALSWTFQAARDQVRVVGVIVIAAVGVALALSLSRGGWLAATAGLLVWIAWVRPRLAILVGVAGGGLVLVPLPGLSHLRSGLLARDAAAALRLDELREAVRVIGRFPWLGAGFGETPHADLFLGVSNAWLWVAERAGLLAAGVAALTFGGALATSVRQRGRGSAVARPITAALVAVFVAGLVDHHIASFPHLVMLVGILMAAAVVQRMPAPRAG